jgi:hypothetical protein
LHGAPPPRTGEASALTALLCVTMACMTTCANQAATRKCAGCGYRFRPSGGELYCCDRCALPDAMYAIYTGLRRFAQEQASLVKPIGAAEPSRAHPGRP